MKPKRKRTAGLLALFLGGVGTHRIYLGYPWWWVLIFIFTGFGFFGGLPLHDCYEIFKGTMKDYKGRDLV